MNCFNFNNKQSYMDCVQSLSDEDIILHRKPLSKINSSARGIVLC